MCIQSLPLSYGAFFVLNGWWPADPEKQVSVLAALVIAVPAIIIAIVDAVDKLGVSVPIFSHRKREKEKERLQDLMKDLEIFLMDREREKLEQNLSVFVDKFCRELKLTDELVEEFRGRLRPGGGRAVRGSEYNRSDEDFNELIVRCTMDLRQKEATGPEHITEIRFFIDFMQTVIDSAKQDKLSYYFARHIQDIQRKKEEEGESMDFDAIACNKRAHPILAFEVAWRLQKPLYLIDTEGTIGHGRAKIDGKVKVGMRFILIQDIINSGETMKRCAEEIRAKQGKVKDVFVLIARTDPRKDGLKLANDLFKKLTGKEVLRLWAYRQLNDSEVKMLYENSCNKIKLPVEGAPAGNVTHKI